MKLVRLSLSAIVFLAALWPNVPGPATAHEGHTHFSAGEPGDPKKPARIVKVTMLEDGKKMLFEPARIEVRRGEQIRFVITNDGTWDHEFMLATKKENDKHAELMRSFPTWSMTIRTASVSRRSAPPKSSGSSPSAASSNTPA
jgi:uncharacterized cupredoxin-like copper-binding protein